MQYIAHLNSFRGTGRCPPRLLIVGETHWEVAPKSMARRAKSSGHLPTEVAGAQGWPGCQHQRYVRNESSTGSVAASASITWHNSFRRVSHAQDNQKK